MHACTAVILLVLFLGNCAANNSDQLAYYKNVQNLFLNQSPNCGNDTGNDLNEAQRIEIIDTINWLRAKNYGGFLQHKKAVLTNSNYLKVRYSCILEDKAKFECNAKLNPDNFMAAENKYTLQRAKEVSKHQNTSNTSSDDEIIQKQQTIFDMFKSCVSMAWENSTTLDMLLSPDVTEIGCFDKICDGYEYIACNINHILNPLTKDLFKTPGKHCKVDSDCTLSGFTRCDADLGLCDFDPAGRQQVLPSVCFGMSSPIIPLGQKKCDNIYDTGSDISQAERKSIVDFIDEMRATINNNCNLGLGVVEPASNYRKMKYSCHLEKEAMFECSLNLSTTFISDKQTWKAWNNKMEPRTHAPMFQRESPLPNELFIDPDTQTVFKNDEKAVFARFFMSEEVTEVGCFVKVCGDKEYIACKSNHDATLPNNAPLYTPGERCNADADCTLPGYPVCDASLGLCDFKSHTARRMEAFSSRCDDLRNIAILRNPEKCNPGEYDTGSDISNNEREIIVHTVNHYRQLINNECDLGLGPVKPISNYRKVKYSCALEESVKFHCSPEMYRTFESDKYTLKSVGILMGGSRKASFLFRAPYKKDMMIDPNDQTMASSEFGDYIRLMLSPDVTEIGCFVKACYRHEYIACKTGHPVVAPMEMPLYTPGNRCTVDTDCTIPGYTQCDVISGLCEIDLEKDSKISPLACLDLASTLTMPLFREKCDNIQDTGSDISQTERKIIVDTINRYRSLINNNCNLGLGVVKPASNYRKVKYSCALEETSKFQCSSDLTQETFTSDELTWRSSVLTYNPEWRNPVFQRCTPLNDLLIDPESKIVRNDYDVAVFAKLFMSEDVTELGCFVKLCGENEFIACKTNHDSTVSTGSPLYTPGRRCNADVDCTLPGYHVCDANLGLCDYKSHKIRQTEAFSSRCDDVENVLIKRGPERCNPGAYYTGNAISNKEREVIVHTVNHYRKLINNDCDFGRGNVKPVSNYRKVIYSCALEDDAKFICSDVKPRWKSDRYFLRLAALAVNDSRIPVFQYWAPYKNDMRIDPNDQTIAATEFNRNFVRLMLSPAVTKIGCFVKVCGEYEYMACKTNDIVVAPKTKPLYTPGKRCDADTHCTLPGYTQCDADSGLCELDYKRSPKVSPLACFTLSGPIIPLVKEECDNKHDTGSDFSQDERDSIVDYINEFRTLINNDCTLRLGVLKPASNYRKVKYSCDLEKELKFECKSISEQGKFDTDNLTWRCSPKFSTDRYAIFQRCSPVAGYLLINPGSQIDDSQGYSTFVRLFMSEDVTEVGCYVKSCGEYEYMQCKSNHNSSLPYDSPIYTPGKRCNVDADCTLPGYYFCDSSTGLCDYKSQYERNMRSKKSICKDRRNAYIHRVAEKCSPYYDTGSDISVKEREVIVHTVNHLRQLVNNNCDLGNGIAKSVTNYRKVKYSCALEEETKFNCSDVVSKWESDEFTLRDSRGIAHRSTFVDWSPWKKTMMISPDDQTSTASDNVRNYLRLMLSPDVTEIGCFVKFCGDIGFMACKTGHIVVAPKNTPLYTPGSRCMNDDDCTLPGYGICDDISGLCEES